MSVEAAVDALVSMNVYEDSFGCLDILKKYFSNAAKPDEKYRKIKKTNDVYQVCYAHFFYHIAFDTVNVRTSDGEG